MGAYKNLTTQDVTITPFNVNKLFTFIGTITTDPKIGIEFYRGIKPPLNYNPNILDTGITYKKNSGVLYYNIRQLYYSNYFGSPSGSEVPLPLKIPGSSPEYDVYVSKGKTPFADNYLQTSLPQYRYFPEAVGSEISIISLPSKIYGDNIVPGSFRLLYPKFTTQRQYLITDDGEGNLKESDLTVNAIWRYKNNSGYTAGFFTSLTGSLVTSSFKETTTFSIAKIAVDYLGENENSYRGKLFTSLIVNPERNVTLKVSNLRDHNNFAFYKVKTTNPIVTRFSFEVEHISSSGEFINNDLYSIAYTLEGSDDVLGHIFYSHGIATLTTGALATVSSALSSSLDLTCVEYSSSVAIYENQYKCHIRENEFQYSLNPTLLSGSKSETYYDFVTGSDFQPYVSCIGLYNDDNDLVAVGKLAQPIPLSRTIDTTFQINFDFSFINKISPYFKPIILPPSGSDEGDDGPPTPTDCTIGACTISANPIACEFGVCSFEVVEQVECDISSCGIIVTGVEIIDCELINCEIEVTFAEESCAFGNCFLEPIDQLAECSLETCSVIVTPFLGV